MSILLLPTLVNLALTRKAHVIDNILRQHIFQNKINQCAAKGLEEVLRYGVRYRGEHDDLNKKVLSETSLHTSRSNPSILREDHNNTVCTAHS